MRRVSRRIKRCRSILGAEKSPRIDTTRLFYHYSTNYFLCQVKSQNFSVHKTAEIFFVALEFFCTNVCIHKLFTYPYYIIYAELTVTSSKYTGFRHRSPSRSPFAEVLARIEV